MTGEHGTGTGSARTGQYPAATGALRSAPAGLWRTITDDGFALAIVLGSVAVAWAAAGIIAAVALTVERILA